MAVRLYALTCDPKKSSSAAAAVLAPSLLLGADAFSSALVDDGDASASDGSARVANLLGFIIRCRKMDLLGRIDVPDRCRDCVCFELCRSMAPCTELRSNDPNLF